MSCTILSCDQGNACVRKVVNRGFQVLLEGTAPIGKDSAAGRGGAHAQVWDCAHGRDPRPVEAPGARKSVGAEINYGVRLDGDTQAERFVEELAGGEPMQTLSPTWQSAATQLPMVHRCRPSLWDARHTDLPVAARLGRP